MASPSLKKTVSAASVEDAPTSPRIRRSVAAATTTATPASPRLRRGIGAVFVPPPASPRLRRPIPAAVVADVPTSPRLRKSIAAAPHQLVKLWPVPPTWERPVVERLEWLTDVVVSHDQTEQRIGHRDQPVRYLEYGFLLEGYELPHAEAVLYALQDQELLIPIWTDVAVVPTTLAEGALSVPVVTAGRDFEDGGQAVLMPHDYGEARYGVEDLPYEVVDIESLEATSIALSRATIQEWGAGARVYPLRTGRLQTSTSWARPTARGARGSVTLELTDPGYASLPALLVDTYQGKDVLPWRANRAQPIDENFQRVVTRIQSVGGTVSVTSRRDRPAITRNPRYLFSGRDEILDLRAWLHRRYGRRKSFYAGSGQRDLELALNAGATDNWLTVKSVRGADLYGMAHGPLPSGTIGYQNPGRRDIEVRAAPTSDPVRRRIEGWARVEPGIEQLHLDAAIGEHLVAGNALISWLPRLRLEVDTVELSWTTSGVVEVEMPTRSL